MKVVTLESRARESDGTRAARRVRREGRIPAVVYGEGKAPDHVSIPAAEFRRAVESGTRVVDLEVGAPEPLRVLLTDVQYDSVGLKLLHADFLRLDPNHAITLRIPIKFEGAPKGLAEGGVLTVQRDVISVRCLPKDIPESITIDVSSLELGESFEASEVALPEGVALAEDAHDVIVGCTVPKAAKAEEPAAAEGAVPGEGAAAAPGAAPAAGAAAAAPAAKAGGEKKK